MRQPRNVQQRRSRVDIGDPWFRLACIAEGFVVMHALADEFDDPAGSAKAVQEAGISEVHSR